MAYLLPLPARDADGPNLAGGWLRFDRVARLERGRPREVVPVSDCDAAELAPLISPRAPVAGLTFDAPRVMGILNITPDSFSDGGAHLAVEAATAAAEEMAGADILDLGAESTRPGAAEIPAAEEIERLAPVLAALGGRRISVDTRKAEVARHALGAGAAMINDVSALAFDPEMAATVAASGAAICLMHSVGTPATMQDDPHYGDVRLDVYDALADRIGAALAAGIPRDRIVVDPGIGFGKTQSHNLALLRDIGLFHGLGVPILLGASRKRFIGDLGAAPAPRDRGPGTLAVTLASVAQGIQIHRVHDVPETVQALALWRAVTGE
ncbi:dihydropteroate synthase [uncultured Jannaschia sp.]|uniref:dihydropteroate synthase n=1 Tax=uncultured Jannaschia sp. TaxID=293347 RepID=UPI002629C4D3|nr:dihydropteroate synthase [uncultured Jannaschia sp.]